MVVVTGAGSGRVQASAPMTTAATASRTAVPDSSQTGQGGRSVEAGPRGPSVGLSGGGTWYGGWGGITAVDPRTADSGTSGGCGVRGGAHGEVGPAAGGPTCGDAPSLMGLP